MKRVLLLFFVLAEVAAFGQKRDEKIEYYTDSEVHRSIVSAQIAYMPYYSNRRILATSANPQSGYYFLNNSVTGQFGQAYGADVYFHVSSAFEVGIGVYNSFAHYTWDAVKILNDIDGSGDTLGGTYRLDIKANYLNVPINFGYSAQVGEFWYLQVYPALELNFLQKLERTYHIDNPDLQPENDEAFGDITQYGKDFNMTINFGLGAEYRVLEKLGIFTRLQFRYMFFEVSEQAVVREVIYTVGGHVGLRYYF